MDIHEKVTASTAYDIPFSYFYGSDFFTAEEYDNLINNIPDNALYEDLRHADAIYDGGSTRRRLMLDGRTLPKVHRIWREVVEAFTSNDYRNAVFNKLQKDLLARFGTLDIKCKPTVILYRDVSGYKILPHPDHRTKVVTTQYYLPLDESTEDLGTELYIKSGEEFKIHQKMKFLPRHGYGFAVSNDSWHGVSQINRPGIIRNSILVIYYLK